MDPRHTIHAPLLPVAASLMAGIVAGYYGSLPAGHVLAATAAVLAAALLLHRHAAAQTAALWLCTACVGALLATMQVERLRQPPRQALLVVVSEPAERGKTIVADALTADGQKVQLRLMKGVRLQPGNGLSVTSPIQPAMHHRLYYDSHGYSGLVFAANGQWTGCSVPLGGLSYMQRARLRLLRLRSHLLERIRQSGLNAETYAVATAMTLGDKSALSQKTRQTYTEAGAAHILALSGLHLSILYWLVTLLAGGQQRRMAFQTAIIAAVWAFAFLTGLSPSICRSAVMLSVYSLMAIGYRERAAVNVLAFTAICMLAVSPLALFDAGFQLSFMAVLAILLLHPLLRQATGLRFLQEHRVAGWLWGLLAVSVAAQLGTAPLVAYYFGRLPAYFLLTNLVVVPGAYAVIVLCLLLIVSQQAVVGSVLSAVVGATVRALDGIARLPGASIEQLHPSALQVALIYVFMACIYFILRIFAARKTF